MYCVTVKNIYVTLARSTVKLAFWIEMKCPYGIFGNAKNIYIILVICKLKSGCELFYNKITKKVQLFSNNPIIKPEIQALAL